MTWIMLWVVRHPFLSLALALALAFGFGAGLDDLEVNTSNRGLMDPEDPSVDFYEDVVEDFGEDSILTLVIKSEDVFQQRILESIERLTLEGGAIDGVFRVVSLTTVSNLKGEEGVLYTDELLPEIPDDPGALAQARADALSNPILIGEVLSADARTAAVHLFIDVGADEESLARVIDEVEQLLEAEREALGERAEIYQVGIPYLRHEVRRAMRRDLVTLLPLASVALMVTLLLFFRSVAAGLLPGVTGGMSVLSTLGLMGLLGLGINTVTMLIPVLLVVIGSTEDIHLIAEYGIGLRSGKERDEAVRAMGVKSGMAILLTSLTTFAGFITMAPNPLPALSEFGFAASFGILVNFVLTVLVLPAFLRLAPLPRGLQRPEKDWLRGLRAIVIGFLDRRKTVIGAAVLLGLLAVVGSFRVVVNTDYLRFFPEESKIRRLYRDVSEHLVGAAALYVVVDTGAPDRLKEPDVLADVAELTDFLAREWDKSIGFADYVRKLHQEINGGDLEYWKIPDSRDLIAQYSLMLDPEDVERFVDFDFQRALILIRGETLGSRELAARLAAMQDFVTANLSRDLVVRPTGEALLITRASDTISRELIISIGWVLVAIFVFISLLFTSFKAGLLAMIPNIFPVLMNFGVMGWLGIPLSVATFPVAVTALGIAVDDTIHFMVRFSKEMKRNSDNRKAVSETLTHELKPVFTTSVALIVGFAMLGFGEFLSTRQFAFLACVTMAVAFLADLLITPALLETVPLISAWDLLRLRISDEVLASSPLFRGLKASEVKRVALLGSLVRNQPGEYVLRQGDEGADVVVLLSGRARVQVEDEASDTTRDLGTVEAGDVIGEVAFFLGGQRTASVIATEESEALHIDGLQLARVQARNPRVAAKVYYNLSQLLSGRLDVATQRLFEAAG